MEMQRRVGPIIYSSQCDNLSVLVVKEVNHENFAAHEEPLLHDRLQELAISWLKTPDPVGTWSCCRPGLRGVRILLMHSELHHLRSRLLHHEPLYPVQRGCSTSK